MNIDKYLHVYKEETLVKMGKDKCIAISRSFPLDDLNRLDISIFRFIHDSKEPLHYRVANMFYWYGKTNKEEELIQLIIENAYLLAKLSKTGISLAKRMFKLGKTFPFWAKEDINYIERVWKRPKAFMWVDPIMYDSYEIEGFNNTFCHKKVEIVFPGYKALKRESTPYSNKLLGEIIEGFKYSEELGFNSFYNRKTNRVSLHLEDSKRTKDDFPFDFWIKYSDFNKFLTETYGARCAYIFAENYLLQEKNEFDQKNFVDFIAKKYGDKCSLIVEEAILNGSVRLSRIPRKHKSFKTFLNEIGWLDVFAGFSGSIHVFQKSNYEVDFLSIIKVTDKYFCDMSLWKEREYIACWLASKFISYCKECKC